MVGTRDPLKGVPKLEEEPKQGGGQVAAPVWYITKGKIVLKSLWGFPALRRSLRAAYLHVGLQRRSAAARGAANVGQPREPGGQGVPTDLPYAAQHHLRSSAWSSAGETPPQHHHPQAP